MLLVSCTIYAFLSTAFSLYSKIVAPLAVVFGYTFIVSYGQGFEYWGNVGFVSFSVIRGFAAMNIGIIVGIITTKSTDWISDSLCSIIQCISVIFITAGFITNIVSDIVIILFIALLFFTIVAKKGIIYKLSNYDIWTRIGKYTYSIYLCHAIVIAALVWLNIHYFDLDANSVAIKLLILIVSVIVYSLAFHYVVKTIVKIFNDTFIRKNKI